MLWPSMMSLAPPPVTPRRKLPPFLGVPAGVEPPPLAADDEEPLLPQAARPPASRTPPAPTSSSRRESESRSMSTPASGLRLSTIESSLRGRVSHRTMLPPPRGRRDDPPPPPPCQVNVCSRCEPDVRKVRRRQAAHIRRSVIPTSASSSV